MKQHIRRDGEVECASGGSVGNPEGHAVTLPNGLIHEAEVTPFTVRYHGDDFAARRFVQRVEAGEFQALVGIRPDGCIGVHGVAADYDTPDRKAWLRRRLREAYRLLTR